MNIQSFLYSKINKSSVIGSIIYGLICVSSTMLMPKLPFRFYSVYTFATASLFYFGMYIVYTSKPRNGVLRFIGGGLLKFMVAYLTGLIVIGVAFSTLYHTSFIYGFSLASNWGTLIMYYTPFIP